MDEALIKEAESLGLNVSMYCLLPANKRNRALRLDIDSRRKEVAKFGQIQQKQEPEAKSR